MIKQIMKLTGIQLVNLFGINEVRFSKDKKKRARYVGLAFVWLLLCLWLAGYVSLLTVGFLKIGMGELVPAYLFAITSLLMLFTTFLKAGSVIFQMNTISLFFSLPVSKAAIVVSRFATMYMTDLLISLPVMLPGLVLYGISAQPGVLFIIYCVVGIILLPLLPITIATAFGAGITAISSRMRHKSLVASILTMLLVLVVLSGSMALPGSGTEFDVSMLQNLADVMGKQIGRLYPPAIWFADAVVWGKAEGMLVLALVSLLAFGALVALLQRFFLPVCTALNTTEARNNYRLKTLTTASPLKALWKRELKRYFASSIYVTNTLMGYLLMAAASVALFIMGPQKLEEILGLPGVVGRALPLFLGLVAAIMPSTSCSVSMEGRQRWIAQTLPVRAADIWNSKILVNLTIALPFYVVSVLFAILAVKPALAEGIRIAVLPLVYILFTAQAGITVNLAMPIFDWENEMRVVKQSASTFCTMLLGMGSALLPIALLFVFPGAANLIYLVTAIVLLLLTCIFAVRNAGKSLRDSA